MISARRLLSTAGVMAACSGTMLGTMSEHDVRAAIVEVFAPLETDRRDVFVQSFVDALLAPSIDEVTRDTVIHAMVFDVAPWLHGHGNPDTLEKLSAFAVQLRRVSDLLPRSMRRKIKGVHRALFKQWKKTMTEPVKGAIE